MKIALPAIVVLVVAASPPVAPAPIKSLDALMDEFSSELEKLAQIEDDDAFMQAVLSYLSPLPGPPASLGVPIYPM
ncbi:hypothetical protein EOD42_14365 [Rhodovarius crocodyli]|uniref:Uncharacterized protein n=1 Tax=Rhodovarius crocodyli TaxID=1979269 RepID=A0A437MF47_9PROT|nr:hypothetical protein [Rhodovarius crocodyli]RVT96291.1 hypothetical protein EOD42_14365 [Rhodovarius crocodyli]